MSHSVRQFVTLVYTWDGSVPKRLRDKASFALHKVGAELWHTEIECGDIGVYFVEYWRYWPVDDAKYHSRLFANAHVQMYYGNGHRLTNTMGWTTAINPHARKPHSKFSAGRYYRENKRVLDARLWHYTQSLRRGDAVATFVRGDREQRAHISGAFKRNGQWVKREDGRDMRGNDNPKADNKLRPRKERSLPVKVRKTLNNPERPNLWENMTSRAIVKVAVALRQVREAVEEHGPLPELKDLHAELLGEYANLVQRLQRVQSIKPGAHIPNTVKVPTSKVSATQWDSLSEARGGRAFHNTSKLDPSDMDGFREHKPDTYEGARTDYMALALLAYWYGK